MKEYYFSLCFDTNEYMKNLMNHCHCMRTGCSWPRIQRGAQDRV